MAVSEDLTFFRVGFTDQEMALLMELSEACHVEPAVLVASIVADVLRDDACAIAARSIPEHQSLH